MSQAKTLVDSLDDKRLVWVELAIATVPPAGLISHMKDRYWTFHKDRGILFWRPHMSSTAFPQCNGNESVAQSVNDKLWAHLGCETLFVPSVFFTINPHDYC